ncbi:TIGR04283 family arsenosugar biosynthesis glycosyltransferase [Maridesulfovibrio hydrothermalis]|uniref:Glycosyl transferase family 2 n=1 Tax=Maridesulfovibrio hydrothermalis AM13 = DSM 14728 TaxID=1121451 RepID=L0RF18_9BACT|nr:TIGR04283 family arsenosugar biosynthesis glycosyltransferase [Maridesulfovibrio hydrothermalis]CCO25349.1 Glycosyl transferase family 2 [Maridesulfovibrio hydrothermalis AM13 = DSM 14728]
MLFTSTISIIIPVFNEQKNISSCIQNVRQCCNPECEIIVVDGALDGGTIAEINDPSIITMQSKPGRAIQMNSGAEAATGEILLFLHADSILPSNAAAIIQEALNAPAATAGAFKLSFDDDSFMMKLVAAFGNLRTSLERVPYGDQAPFISKKAFHDLGGFSEIPIMEDVDFFRRIKKQRQEIVILKQPITTSARRYLKTGPVRCILRNWMLRILHLCGVSPTALATMYHRQGD